MGSFDTLLFNFGPQNHQKTDLEDRLNLQKLFNWKLSRLSDRSI